MELYFDGRWRGIHGIGRFSSELEGRLKHAADPGLSGRPLSGFGLLSTAKFLLSNPAAILLSPGFNGSLPCRNRMIITVHDLIHLHIKSERSFAKTIYYKTIVKGTVKSAPVIFTVSESTKSDICDWAGVLPSNVIVTGNGLSSSFCPQGDVFRHRLPYFLYVGNTKPHKNIDVLLQAFRVVSTQCGLLMSGNPSNLIKEKIQQFGVEGDVTFLGKTTDDQLATYYRGAIATVMPSKYEGFGFPVLEAMGTGCPVISSNTTSLPEVGSDVPLYFNPDSVDELVQRMRSLLNSDVDQEDLRRRGIERAKCFSWESVAHRVRTALVPLME